ncbi:MAG: C69 family dipeptidase [Sutterellaceae bacterium]|nr:C69 family dipeptidase [Sutterellaceae bacterium]
MCTTIIAAEGATADGSFLLARSADSSALKAQHFVIHEAADHPAGALYRTADHCGATRFEWPLPARTLRYTTIPNWKTGLHGAAGFNEAGVGVTGTESIFARDDALLKDPLNTETGITEDDIADVLLCEAKTAREACALLGRIIEEKGAGEGFGVGFVDETDIWYLETGTAHQWMARRIPRDMTFASANQGRFKAYSPDDPSMMASSTLVSFAVEAGLYDPEKDGAFDFSRAYIRDDERDRIYNDPRVWSIQKILTPALEQKPDDGRNFPLFTKPGLPVTVDDVKRTLRDHYEGTDHDPYGERLNGGEPWRPVSVFRTYEAHILQVRPWLPRPVGEVIRVAFGMADLSCFLPFYAGLSRVPAQYGHGTDKADRETVYWQFRKLQTLVMTDYPKLAPVVKKAFAEFEQKTDGRMAEFEKEYVRLASENPAAAQEALDRFNLGVLAEGEELAERLTDEAFTIRTADIESAIFFANCSKKD